jgi:3-phenylpropionate/trans-cinnamate dioxygenase ferredoxin reductase component
MSTSTIAIVGGGLATARVVKAYREAGGTDPIRIFSADIDPPYHRPPLSKRYLRGEIERDGTLVEPESFYAENDADLRLGTVVRSVAGGAVELADGERVEYGRLVIASGATPRRLPVPGMDLDGVFTLRTLSNSTSIREHARDARRAVVVGTGFVGLEVTASLRTLGVEVTIVDRGTELFRVAEAPPLSAYLAGLYREQGVDLLLNDGVAEIGGDGRVEAVTTTSGERRDAELVVVGIGVVPETEFLEDSGLELSDGVVVNERFETSQAGVYAVGDVARFYDPVFGRPRRIEHWSNANYQGAELGRLLAGAEGGYDVVSTFFTELFGKTFKVFGDTTGHDDLVMRGDFRDGSAIGFYLRGGKIVATVLTGQEGETEEHLKELIRARAPLAEATV